MLPATGDPTLDRLIAENPALGAFLERQLRYGQTRWAEVWLACVMAVFGAVLLGSGDTFSAQSFRVIRLYVGEDTAGWTAVAVGGLRLVALWYNGRKRPSALARVLGCVGGFLFYTAITIGFALSGPPLPTGMIYGVLAIAELHSSGRAGRDVSVLDSLGIRRRRRDREQRAARG